MPTRECGLIVTPRIPRGVVLLACGLIISACGNPDPPTPRDVVVELDAFSGRPNPTWTLSPADAGEVARRLNDLPPADRQEPTASLGYRGFRIRNPGGEGGIPEELYIARGIVRTGPDSLFRDAHGVEQWLKEFATRNGYADVFAP